MNTNPENVELLREIRDLLAEREQAYQTYLAESRAEYEKYMQEAAKTRQMTGAQVGAVSLWLFGVVFAAHLAAGFVMKTLAFCDTVNLEVM